MKSALMVMVTAFLLGLTGGAGFMFVKKTRGTGSSLADSLAAASDSAAAAQGDSARAGLAGEPLALDPMPAPVAVDTAGPATEAGTGPGASQPAPEHPEMEPKRLAKLFGQMQPRDAARVMAQMTDREIQAILSLLGDRQASAILGTLPPERAAAVSRLVMNPNERTTP